MDETSIISACIKGDKKAQKTVFEMYSKGMLMLCRRYVKNDQDAEEMLLNGFYKFFATIERFEYTNDKSVGGWLKKIMVNECLLLLRKKNRMNFVSEEFAGEAIINDNILSKMNATVILRLINSLPDGYRLVFNMHVIEGYNHREIGELLDISEGTSKSQLFKAKIFLQQLLQKEELVHEK